MAETFNQAQIRKQTNPPVYSGQRQLDFTPFEAALASAEIEPLHQLLADASVADMVALQTDGALSSAEITTYYLHQIRANQHLNAVLELNPDALVIAAQRDAARLNQQPLGSLHGIPILLKDNIATGDKMHTTAGAKVLEDAQADRDAFIVTRLRDAGAIILGKANLSEWANFMTSDSSNGFSLLGGQTRNPHGDFDVSGSSSGSAAAVAAGLAPLAIGSETSGSLISPASQNGIVSLKPSLGYVSRDRIIPITAGLDTAGPMARTVADAERLMRVLAGADEKDAMMQNAPLFEPMAQLNSLAGLRFGMVRNADYERGGEEAILQGVKRRIELAGGTVVDLTYPSESAEKINYLAILLYGMQHDLSAYLQATNAPVRSAAEIVAFNKADLPNRAPYGQDDLERAADFEMSSADYERSLQTQRVLAGDIIDTLMSVNNVDVILSFGNHFTRIYAPAGYPALTVNAGYRSSGEPLGLTFVGNNFSDARLFAIGAVFEATE